jgi:pyruvate/2-oxoglutarate dehydrogenase complex dihydrolipoamide acyltransferase (E2) component
MKPINVGLLGIGTVGGGTFTVDNTGWFGSNLTMPIINVPEVAILTMEAITKRAVVVETPQNLTKRQRDLLAEFDKDSSTETSPESTGFFSKVKDFFGGGA